VLGINASGGQSACLIGGDGRTVATSEPQRGGAMASATGRLPARAITACLDSLGVAARHLDLVVLCGGAPVAVDAASPLTGAIRARVHTIDEELALACGAFYPSGFEHAAVLVVGRASTASHGAVRATGYRACGGPPVRVSATGDRGADGGPTGPLGAICELVGAALDGFDLASLLDLAARGTGAGCALTGRPAAAELFPGLMAQRAARRHGVPAGACADEAWVVRELLERLTTQLARELVQHTGARKLCVAGDAAVHGLARLDPRGHRWVDQLYAPPAPGEVGAAVGAALFGWCELIGEPPPCELEGAFRGRPYGDADVVAALASHGVTDRTREGSPDRVLDDIAELLASGALVAWFDGGAELGEPLDGRCVLAGAGDVALAPRFGARLERAAFRAPTAVVLVEDAEDYFELIGPSPFAHRVAAVTRDRTREIPLVVRGDGTCRVHTIDAWRAPRLHDLLTRYRRRTGRSVLASAPLGRVGAWTVDSPRDALRQWDRAGLDAIFLEGHLVVRHDRPGSDDES